MTSYYQDLLRVGHGAGSDARRPSRSRRGPDGEVILVAEDDDACRRLVVRILEDRGYTVLQARDGSEALRISDTHPGPIHLLVSDVVMPGADGPKVAECLGAHRPTTKVLYMSGYPGDVIERHGLRKPEAALLAKPFTPAQLRNKVHELLDASGARGVET